MRQADERNKQVTSKYGTLYSKYESEINNTQIDNMEDLDVTMPIYNLTKYSNNSKTWNLWQYCRKEPNSTITDSQSLKFKARITGRTPADGNPKDVEIAVPLTYLSYFYTALEMPLINCEKNLILTLPENCVISNSTGARTLSINDTKLYVPVASLPTFFFNWDSLHARLNSHYKTESYKKKHKKIRAYRKFV